MLRGDGDDRTTFVPRGDDARDEVCRAGPGVAEHGGDLAGRLVEPFGHVDSRRFVTHREEADVVAFEGGQHRVELRPGQAEHEAHAFIRKTAYEQLSTVDLSHGTTSSLLR